MNSKSDPDPPDPKMTPEQREVAGSLGKDFVERIDQALLENCCDRNRKVARVVGTTMMDLELRVAGLRYLFAAHPQAMGKVLGIVYREISTHLIHKAGYSLKKGATGAVTLIQRFGSALNLNIHFHIVFLDGVYLYRDHRPPRYREQNFRGNEKTSTDRQVQSTADARADQA